MIGCIRNAGLAVFLGMALAGQAHAYMYKCGKQYQDRPCGTEERRTLGPGYMSDRSGKAPAMADPSPASSAASASRSVRPEEKKAAAGERKAKAQRADTRTADKKTARKTEKCDGLNADLERVRLRQRLGGNLATTEALKREHQATTRKISAAGC